MSDWSQDCEDLFAAGRLIDEPSAEDRQRVALRIAAQVAAAAAGTATAVVSLTTAAGTAGTTAATVSKIGTGLSLAKVLISLAVGVGAVGVVTTAVVKSSEPPERARVTEVQTWSRPHSASMDVPPVEDLPTPAAQATVAPSVSTTPPIASTVPSLPARKTAPEGIETPPAAYAATATEDTASEARLVRGIDDALRHHDVATAQRLLGEHDATFPHGHFTEECAAARVLARCDGTPTDDARDAACTFFAQHPRSPMRARIEESCATRCEP